MEVKQLDKLTAEFFSIFIKFCIFAVIVLILLAIIKLLVVSRQRKLKIGINPQGIIFGKSLFLFKWFSPQQNEGHIAVVGSPGTGKTQACLVPTLRSWGGTSFNIDISGDISKNVDMENMLIFAPLDEETIKYNPFYIIDQCQTEAEKIEYLINICEIIIPFKAKKGEPAEYYEKSARDILIASFIAFYFENYDFIDICETILNNDYQMLFQKIDKTENFEAIKYINQFQGNTETIIANCKAETNSSLEIFTNSRIKHCLQRDKNAINPVSIEKYNIFLSIEDKVKEQYAPLIELITGQFLNYLAGRPLENKNKILLSIDEYASFKNLDVSQALAKYRKRNVRVMVLFQSLAQMDLNFGHNWTRTLLDTCEINAVFKQEDVESREYFSKKSGTYTNKDGEEKPNFQPIDFGRLKKHLIVFSGGHCFRVRKNFK